MSQRYVINENLINDFCVESIVKYTRKHTHTQILQHLKNKFGASYQLVAEQVELYEKLKIKLPQFAEAGCLVTRRSLEQCSSEALANYKASLFNGSSLIDLSGGLGIDDIAFSRCFTDVISVDPDKELNEIVRYNFNRLLIKNLSRIDSTAEDFVAKLQQNVDVFYVDADRRSEEGKKIFSLEDSTPDVVKLMPDLLSKSLMVILKLSPMIDIAALTSKFTHIRQISVIGIRNEVKEVLIILNNEDGPAVIKAVELDAAGKVLSEFSKPINKENDENVVNDQASYFYEPSNMIIKAGLSKNYAQNKQLKLIHKNSHYMLGEHLIDDYFGRSFVIITHFPFSKSSLNKYLKEQSLFKANVSARNFVTSVDELRKTFNLQDGGEEYLFFTQNSAKDKIFFHCRKA